MKASSLRGKAVVSIADAEKVGTIHDLLLDPDARRVEALWIKTTPDGVMKTIAIDDVKSLGRDALTITDTKVVRDEYPARDGGTVDLGKLQGTKVLTHSGDLVGTVSEVEIDPSNFGIVGYEISTGALSGLIGGKKKLTAAVHYGEDILMVADSVQTGRARGETRKSGNKRKAA